MNHCELIHNYNVWCQCRVEDSHAVLEIQLNPLKNSLIPYMQVFKCMHLLQNQQETMHLNFRCAKYQYKIHIYGLVRSSINYTSCAHGVTIEKARYKLWPGRRRELLLDTDKPRGTFTTYTCRSRLCRWLVCLLLSSKARKNVCN